MVTYNALSAVQIFTFYTGSEYVHNFLTAVQYDFVKGHPHKYTPEYPVNTKVFVDTTIPEGKTYCVVINPYTYFVGMWNANSVKRTKDGFTPFTFAEFTNDYVSRYATSRALSGRSAPITYQLTTAQVAPSAVRFLKAETIADGIKHLPKIDLTITAQLLAFNEFIANGAATIGNSTAWKSQYNQTLADLVYSTNFVSDFTAFGYEKDSWK